MNTIEINSLPKILFSHIYKADSYSNSFAVRSNFIEVSYIFEGAIIIENNEGRFTAEKGDVICFLRNSLNRVSTSSFHCHHTVGAMADWAFSQNEQALLLPTVLSAENNTSHICRLIDEIIHNQLLYRYSATKGASKFLELLCALDQQNRKNLSSTQPSELLYTNRAKSFIEQNIHSSITQNSVAEHLGISPEYLCSVFKKTEGVTVMRYINAIKLENIKTLMDNTNLKLYEASAVYGYNDPNYVSRLYKKLFGYNITDKAKIHPVIDQ